jgi:uncharacterized protein
MAITNYDRVGKALDLLRQGLKPYIEREMEAALGKYWLTTALQALPREPEWPEDMAEPHLDAHALLLIMWHNWNKVFRNTLGHAERSLVSELREVRNQWAHQQAFSSDDTYRALDSIERLLTAVSAPEAREVEQQKQEILRVRFAEQARHERRKATSLPIEGKPASGLQPWREVVTPHPDVASGRYQQAEFAADLDAVYRRPAETASEYSDPREFFQRTYLTEGLRHLLRTALLRLSGQGGDPVVELQTNFGGGKTHSMLALYHLFAGLPAAELAGIETLLGELQLDSLPGQARSKAVQRPVLVGTAISPGQPHIHPDGTTINTLWGEMAWQLGGAEGYGLIAQADQSGTNPGSNLLRELMHKYSPCLVLIDEWVAYTRQLYVHPDDRNKSVKRNYPGGTFEANMSFAQSLTEAAKQVPTAMVVASLPASDIETGGEGGREALAQLKNTFSRIESAWRPASTEEGFEIVRRRLFQPLTDARKFAIRDAVVSAFGHLYREQSQEFPSACGEGEYERRMQAAYPIHPELFDRLYGDWSSLEKFQRTRGVLRLMAAVIHGLWERNDSGLLILPANVPVDAGPVQFELARYLEDNWVPVIERDVDGPNSLPLTLDRENPNLGRYSACRRVARTVYLGSAPTAKTKNPGLDERNIKLGCVQPGETVATFGDALRRLTDRATHLYIDRSRYWFSVQPSVTRLAQDRAAQFEIETVWENLQNRLRLEQRQRGDLAGVHVTPASSADVPDEMAARLVILGPQSPHTGRDETSPARQAAQEMLTQRGTAPRLYQNMLVFLAPDRTRLAELEESIRQFLAWKSIQAEQEQLNLDAFQRSQAKTKQEQADTTVASRIKETYIWLLVPEQPDPRQPALEWQESRLQVQEALAVQASRKLINDALLYTQFSAILIQMELDKFNLWQGANHLNLKQLWEYMARYPYLSRLRDQNVLLAAIRDGIGQLTWQDFFAYASGWDETRQRYLGLMAGQLGSVVLDGQSLIVKPEAAQRQLDQDKEERRRKEEEERQRRGEKPEEVELEKWDEGQTKIIDVPQPEEKKPRRFYGTVELNDTRVGRDAGQIAEAVIQHLASLVGAKVTITLEIHAELPDGAPDHVVRTVSENAHTLKFKDFGFEEA